MLRYKTKIDVV